MSVVLVCLPNAPKVSEEAVRKDAELNKYLESRVEGENGDEPIVGLLNIKNFNCSFSKIFLLYLMKTAGLYSE